MWVFRDETTFMRGEKKYIGIRFFENDVIIFTPLLCLFFNINRYFYNPVIKR